MSNWPQTWAETFNDSIEQKFKITELKEKFDIQVSQEELLEYTNALFTMKEVQKIKAWISSVSELAKAKLDILNQEFIATEQVRKTQQRLNKRIQNWVEEAKQSGEKAEGALNSWLEMVNETSESISDSDAWKKVKQLWDQTKNAINKWAETVKELGFLGVLENAKKNWGFWWMMAWFLLGILKMFWMTSKVEDIKEKLSSIEIKETKIKIIEILNKEIPWKKEQIENIINSPSIKEEQIKIIYDKIKDWEKITIKDIYSTIPELSNIFSVEEKEKLLKEAKQKTIASIKKSIETKYPNMWEITWDKLVSLEKLVHKYFNLSNTNELVLHKIVKDRWFQINDLYWLLIESTSKWTWFTMSLVSEWIIPISAIGIDIIDSSVDIFKISLWWMWITEQVSYEDLMNKIWDIEHPELLLWLLYRKGWLLFSILWDISKVASQIAIENLTNTSVKSTSLISASFHNNFEKQASNFQKISEAMWVVDNKTSIVIKEATQNLNQLQKNYKILSILENSENISSKKELISKILGDTIPWDIDDLSKLKTHVSSKFKLPHINRTLSNASLLNKFGFWKSADLYDLNRKLGFIYENQISILKNEHIAKSIWKIREIFEIWEVSRLWDKVIYHFDDINQASKFSKLANKFPELLGGLLDKLPIIAVAWLAVANEDKMENLKTWLWSLVPFVWPIMLLWEGGVYLDENNEVVVKNPVEAWMWWVLLWLDTAFLLKESIKWWIKWAGWYMIKPIKDIYSIWRWSLEVIDSIAKIGKWTIIKEALIKGWKNISKIPLLWKQWVKIALTLLLAYWTYELLTDDEKENYKKLIEEWLITKEWDYWETLKNAIKSWEINEDEKQLLVELIVSKNSPTILENIDLKIDGDELKISWLNSKIKSDFFVTEQTIIDLKDLFWISYNSNNCTITNI